jgi:DNA gyrase/topoisomerase IV subunit B
VNTSSTCVLALIAYSVHEHQVGDAKRIRVVLKPRECVLEDDGRGVGLDREGYVTGLVEQLTDRQCGTVLHGLGLAITAMASPLLVIQSHRHGRVHEQAFSWGRALRPAESSPGTGGVGTRVMLAFSPEAPAIEPQDILAQVDHWRALFPALVLDVEVSA